MPSLFRFLTVVAIIGGIVYGVIFALANFVNPKPREMIFTTREAKFSKNKGLGPDSRMRAASSVYLSHRERSDRLGDVPPTLSHPTRVNPSWMGEGARIRRCG